MSGEGSDVSRVCLGKAFLTVLVFEDSGLLKRVLKVAGSLEIINNPVIKNQVKTATAIGNPLA